MRTKHKSGNDHNTTFRDYWEDQRAFLNTYKKQLPSSLSADDSVAEELLLLSLFELTSE